MRHILRRIFGRTEVQTLFGARRRIHGRSMGCGSNSLSSGGPRAPQGAKFWDAESAEAPGRHTGDR
jgi:hypothetical protein